MSKPVALITGAGRGIGRALAQECAKRGFDLVLVSLPGEGLAELAGELESKFQTVSYIYECDLLAEGEPERIKKWTTGKGITISFLINNAGMGTHGPFATEKYFNASKIMLRLNMHVPHDLTWLYLPELLAQKQAWILFTASSAGLFPVPYKAGYSGSKSFIIHLARALRYELKNTSVKVSVLCPSGVPTNPAIQARIEAAGLIGRLSASSAEQVAEYAVRKTFAGKQRIIPGGLSKFAYFLSRALPVRMMINGSGRKLSKDSGT